MGLQAMTDKTVSVEQRHREAAALPCPCGAQPKHGYHSADEDECGYGYVECHENGLTVLVHAETEAEAIAAWNTRQSSADRARIERLEAALREARPIVEVDLDAAKDTGDADLIGQSRELLAKIDAALKDTATEEQE